MGVHKIHQVIHPMLTFWISRSTLKFCVIHISIWWIILDNFDGWCPINNKSLAIYTLTSICIFSILAMHMFYTFPKLPARRICVTIQSFFGWWSFLLFSWPECLIQEWHYQEKLDTIPTKRSKGYLVSYKLKSLDEVLFIWYAVVLPIM